VWSGRSLQSFERDIIRAIAQMMETVSTSETSVNFYQTTWRNNPEEVIFIVAAVTASNLKSKYDG
jgi:ribosomal protein L18E